MGGSNLFNVNRVLAVIDPDLEIQPAIQRLEALAKVMDFEVKLVVCDYIQYLVEGYYFSNAELPALRASYLSDRKEKLESLAKPLRDNGLSVETDAIWSHPRYSALLEQIDDYKPDLVIQHTKCHGALSRLVLTHDDWQMVRHCPVPLLMVKEKPWSDHPTILTGVDPMHTRAKPSGLDHKLLGIGQSLSRTLAGELYAVHSYMLVPFSGVYPLDAEQQHRDSFAKLTGEYSIEDSHSKLINETPEYALSTLEDELEADLVIVGSISRSYIEDAFVGSTTEKVLDFLESDILLIKPDISND